MSDVTRKPLTTLNHTCGDAAEALSDVTSFVAQTTINGLKRNVINILISCETNDIRYSFNATPTQVGLGHILAVGDSIEVVGPKFITALKFINKTNAANAVLQITPEIGID